MKIKSGSEKALEYIESHAFYSKGIKTGPCITVSRQSGAGSGVVDEKLKEILESHQEEGYGKWEIFDKNLIEKVLEDHNLPERLASVMTREKFSSVNNVLSEILGLQPSMRTLLHKTAQTILQLAYTGNVIIVGRGGNLITANLQNTFHVRLVAPLEDRINRIKEYYNLNRKDAVEFVKKEDTGREEYVRKNFHKNIDDPLAYHLIINTNLISYQEGAGIIAGAVMSKFPQMFRIK